MTKNSNKKFTDNSNIITTTEVAIDFNDFMQGKRMLTSKAIGKRGLEEWGNKEIINKILVSNPDLNSMNIDWIWVKHSYIKLLSLVLDIEKNCNLPDSSLTNDKIKNAINCIKNDSKFNIIKINWDEISTKDKRDFFSELFVIVEI